MVDIQRFEALLEALDKEIEELPQGSVKNNLIDIHSGLYSIFEDVSLIDFDEITEEVRTLKRLLTAYLSYEDKQYIRIKYGIDL